MFPTCGRHIVIPIQTMRKLRLRGVNLFKVKQLIGY